MSLIKLKAKVLLSSEEDMEAEAKYDLGNIAKSKEWVWRNIAMPVDEVYRIIEYSKGKTIVQLYDEEKILVNEPFEDVFNKWQELKQDEKDKEEVLDIMNTEEKEEDEEDEE